MIVRFRVVASPDRLFNAPALESVACEQVPRIGDAHHDVRGSYRVVKVMEDVDPDHGRVERGPVVYVVKEGRTQTGGTLGIGLLNASFIANPSQGLRDCIERANAARRTGSIEQYRRHIEEFLFLSNAVARGIGPGPRREHADAIPYLPIYSKDDRLVSRFRDGLIMACFSAHVQSVRSINLIASMLDRVDVNRPTLFIISEPILLRSGSKAVQSIRDHTVQGACPILVLTLAGRDVDSRMAMDAGATATHPFPQTIAEYPALVTRIRTLLTSSRTAGDQVTELNA
ncbi:MAG: hypothetical protein H0W83_05025 [Planctomycetes bacterium]|nr:hypothetical protein [Planctomycetota bacterium]